MLLPSKRETLPATNTLISWEVLCAALTCPSTAAKSGREVAICTTCNKLGQSFLRWLFVRLSAGVCMHTLRLFACSYCRWLPTGCHTLQMGAAVVLLYDHLHVVDSPFSSTSIFEHRPSPEGMSHLTVWSVQFTNGSTRMQPECNQAQSKSLQSFTAHSSHDRVSSDGF